MSPIVWLWRCSPPTSKPRPRTDMTARLSDETSLTRLESPSTRSPTCSIWSPAGNSAGAGGRSITDSSRAAGDLRPPRRAPGPFAKDADRLAAALGGILAALGIEQAFERRDMAGRAAVLLRLLAGRAAEAIELAWPRPGARRARRRGASSGLLARNAKPVRPRAARVFVISMTRGVADVLGVLLLARWAGVDSSLSIVPFSRRSTTSGPRPRSWGAPGAACLPRPLRRSPDW